MKIKRFFAKDMRSALAQVKDTLGSDAVIMSNKKVPGGIEIVAAVDYDEPKVNLSKATETPPSLAKSMFSSVMPQGRELSDDTVSLGASQNSVRARNQSATAPANRTPLRQPLDSESQSKVEEIDSLQALLAKQHAKLQQVSQSEQVELPAWARGLEQAQQPTPAAPPRSHKRHAEQPDSADMNAMREELSSLRNLLTHQLSSLMTDQKQRQDPVGAMLEKRLLEAEFSPKMAAKLSALTQHYTTAELVHTLPQSLANMLNNQGDDIVNRGGVVAFVGPTGVGKTTTLAKLAARFAAKHGCDSVALITMDHYRIGAFEQLATYGKIMGCPVKQAHDLNELEQILYQFRNRKLVLIDTAGMGQRDMRLYQQLDNLAASKRLPIRSYLVLSATSQRKVMEDAVRHFQRIPLAGAVLTKMDESVSLAAALSTLVASDLPLSYVTDGQRVPEDMQVADTLALAKLALAGLDVKSQELQETWSDSMAYAFE
ncbi:flagellar biosynthesis protein FlhF [Shewanella sp. NIFS-20-20]|uniref:flagellar biosynthesis protein FlhF n=1 Tax=Shewanella sp. NIFS-20-20 TaxID=2853806 RepID=UPI001C4743AC|nr:flagellar biosynthesis protein FlhF [Shewanella sp. NIFS-20-20]MBV7314807.1 flagellar biosynthesis protein FlhF [Shewanella sp. NIFS-20-20]